MTIEEINKMICSDYFKLKGGVSMKFQKGDIVKVIDGGMEGEFGEIFRPEGSSGYVLLLSSSRGWAGFEFPEGYTGWSVSENQIKLSHRPKFKRGDKVKITNEQKEGHVGTIFRFLPDAKTSQYIVLLPPNVGWNHSYLHDIDLPENTSGWYVSEKYLEAYHEDTSETPKFKVGDTVRIINEDHLGVSGQIGKIFKIMDFLGIPAYFVSLPEGVGWTCSHLTHITAPEGHTGWNCKESQLELSLPNEPIYLDVQGEPIKFGDEVMLLNARHDTGKIVTIEKFIMWYGDMIMKSGKHKKFLNNVVKINTFLPLHVIMEMQPNQPRTIHVALLNKDDTKVIKRAKAICSPTDTFDFEYGLFGVALPRLFGRPMRE